MQKRVGAGAIKRWHDEKRKLHLGKIIKLIIMIFVAARLLWNPLLY